MENLPIQDITSLFVVLDDVLQKKEQKVGRPSALSDSEMLCILIWCTAVLRMKHLKSVYEFLHLYHLNDFPKLPDYSSFIRHCHRLMPLMWKLLEQSLDTQAAIRFADSTMLPVCKKIRANEHDAQQLPYLVNVVGDTTYGARVMKGHLWETKGVFILAPPHPSQRNKVLTFWQKNPLGGTSKN